MWIYGLIMFTQTYKSIRDQTIMETFYFLLRIKEMKMFFFKLLQQKEDFFTLIGGCIRVNFNLDQLD